MPLKCPQFSSLSGYFFFQLIGFFFFWTHTLTSVPTCPAQYCDSYGVMYGRLCFWGTDRPWSVASDFREEAWLATLGFRRNTSAWLPWSLTVAVPAALPPPHGPSVCLLQLSQQEACFHPCPGGVLSFLCFSYMLGMFTACSTYPRSHCGSKFSVPCPLLSWLIFWPLHPLRFLVIESLCSCD